MTRLIQAGGGEVLGDTPERRVDILPLAQLFLGQRLRALGRSWRPEFSPEVRDVFLAHPWPGNIRQLQSVCDRAADSGGADRS